jgi:ubiquinone/menaquinone biosynthesis C-methylase UbiE
MLTLIAIFAILLLLLTMVIGYSRTTLIRKIGIESIEDPEAIKAYDRISRTPQFAFMRRMFVKELKKHNPTGTIVDMGCGPGYLITVIAKEIPQAHILGIDTSEEMLATASKNLSSLGFGEKTEFRRGGAQSLPLENDSVENVVSTFSLHHWSDPTKAFQEIHRVLKPGGQFLVLDLRRDPRRFFYWLIIFATKVVPLFLGTRALKRINEPLGSVLASYTPSELVSFLSRTPFSRISLKGGVGWFFLWGQK